MALNWTEDAKRRWPKAYALSLEHPEAFADPMTEDEVAAASGDDRQSTPGPSGLNPQSEVTAIVVNKPKS